ncbi:9331_t:CDS:2, partial [Gigaspora margarita]
ERTELKGRIANLLRHAVEENKVCDTENAKLKTRIEELESENVKFRDRIMKVEQRQLQNDAMQEFCRARDQSFLTPKISITTSPSKHKSLKDIETDNFLDMQSKKEVSNMMIKRNREKKFQTQELHNTSLLMLIPPILSEVSISNISDGDNLSKVLLQKLKQKPGQNISAPIYFVKIAQEKGNREYCLSDILLLDLAQLFNKATDAEYSAIKANQEETLCWINYENEFIIQYNDIIKNSHSKIGKKKAKGIIYDKILEHLIIIHKRRFKEIAKIQNVRRKKKECESMAETEFLEYKQNFEAKMGVPTTSYKKELKNKSLALIEYA